MGLEGRETEVGREIHGISATEGTWQGEPEDGGQMTEDRGLAVILSPDACRLSPGMGFSSSSDFLSGFSGGAAYRVKAT